MNQPRSINSANPFTRTAREYIEKNWSVVPLPRRQKDPPPTGTTGRVGRIPDDEDITKWLGDARYSEGNIALRLGNMLVIDGIKYEVIGIDVDHYEKKHGGEELTRLEREFGKLPDTWTCTSRSDGFSGIRLYLVPYGYGFRDKASKSIDIIQRVHRFAVTYPSWHPDTKTQYFWYEPGKTLDGQSFTFEIPDAKNLTVLSDSWIDYLTLGGMKDTSFGDGSYGIDLDISRPDLLAWVEKNFTPPLANQPGGMCPKMRDAVERQCERIESSDSNHDTLTNAHWNLLHLSCEGHSGYVEAIREVEQVWFKDVKAKDKRRDLGVVRGEMKRSFEGTLRKIKAKADSFLELGLNFFALRETCWLAGDFKPPPINIRKKHWIYCIPLKFNGLDPADYDKNDVGQARHFYERVGDNVRYLADYNGWIIYDGNCWHIDDFTLIRALFDRACVKPCKGRADELFKAADKWLDNGTKSDMQYKSFINRANKLVWIAEHYGNDSKIKAVLNCMKSIPGVGMRYRELNLDTTILAMPGGKCIKLEEPGKPNPKAVGFTIIDNKKEFYTTFSTAVDYLPWESIPQHEKNLWKNYLDLFLPADSVDDKGRPIYAYRKFVQKALGHMLIGGNPEKLAIFLVGIRDTGKSTIIHCIRQTLNDSSDGYGATFQPNSVFKDSNATNPELGNLLYKRGIFSSESGSQRIYANPFKRHTGGDEISVTRKWANEQIKGIPHFTMVIGTNQSPTIDDADEATTKRIMVCRFLIQVQPKQNDKRADVVIARDARHAILYWLLMGYRNYIRERLEWEDWHPIAKAATLEFASELSDVATYLSETVSVANDELKSELNRDVVNADHDKLIREWSSVSCGKLYDNYRIEAEQGGQKPLGARIFAKKVRQVFGVEVKSVWRDGKNAKHYLGLKWKNESAMSQIK